MNDELKALLQRFLDEEVELLEDVAMGVDSPESSNREKALAMAQYAVQVARVGAIRDVLELAGISEA